MYKLTEYGSRSPIYDSENNFPPEGAVYFHTHQLLWKDDILLGRIFIDDKTAKLILGGTLTIPRKRFQEILMRNAPIVELIFNANEVERAKLVLKKAKAINTIDPNQRSVELHDYATSQFYGYLYYWLK